jgi:hypothetical protein
VPMMQTILADLNHAFSAERIAQSAARRDSVAPGAALAAALAPLGVGATAAAPLRRALADYVEALPKSFQEALRGIVHFALSTDPATPVTFAWAPGYDFELTLWHAPDTRATRGGITVLLKSRYPSDAHPVPTATPKRAARRKGS